MSQYVLNFDDRPDGGPRLVGPFGSREAAFKHAENITKCYPELTLSYEAWPLTTPPLDRPGAKGQRTGAPVELP